MGNVEEKWNKNKYGFFINKQEEAMRLFTNQFAYRCCSCRAKVVGIYADLQTTDTSTDVDAFEILAGGVYKGREGLFHADRGTTASDIAC